MKGANMEENIGYYSFDKIKALDPEELMEYINLYCNIEIPIINNECDVEKLNESRELLGVLANTRLYFSSILSYIKLCVRREKLGNNKEAASLMIARRELLQDAVDDLKFQYDVLSRIITVTSMINDELHMSDYRKGKE